MLGQTGSQDMCGFVCTMLVRKLRKINSREGDKSITFIGS
jgi:hypothetical protein